MSQPELRRLEVLQRLRAGELTQIQAASLLGRSERQVRRLLRRYEAVGASGVASRRRGRPSNNHLPVGLREAAVALYRERYDDFGPTFANEKLREVHGLVLSTESLRQALISEGLWLAKQSRRRRLHPSRERRPCFGELVQIDGSPHAWFEERAPRCTLLVFIDDATSNLVALRFVDAETTRHYLSLTHEYLERHGRPLAVYSDRHSIFRVGKGSTSTPALTQVGRAFEELDIELICATSPQAKGRVERANQTLQRRLVRELRLRNISSIQDGNAYLQEFRDDFNQRFARAPANSLDAHRDCVGLNLDDVLCVRFERRVSKDLTIQLGQSIYGLDPTIARHRDRVTILERPRNAFEARLNGQRITCQRLRTLSEQGQLASAKQLNDHLDRQARAPASRTGHVPAANHPWRRPFTAPPSRKYSH